jgi:hypothetical protein
MAPGYGPTKEPDYRPPGSTRWTVLSVSEVTAMPYNPHVGGHAPGHLRALFFALLDLDEDGAANNWPYRRGDGPIYQTADGQLCRAPLQFFAAKSSDPLAWIAAQLRNCDDQMSQYAIADHFDDGALRGGTYGHAARYVMRTLSNPNSALSRQCTEREALRDHVLEVFDADPLTRIAAETKG